MSYADQVAELAEAFHHDPGFWRFWYFDGDLLRSPFVGRVLDQNGRELRLWTSRFNTAQGDTGYHYVEGTDRFINAIRPAMGRFLSGAESRDNAALVIGKVEPENILGPDEDVAPMTGAMRAQSLTITELFVIHQGRHDDAAERLHRRYRVPVSVRSVWETWP
ncbi:hypothetical protein [Gordonia humi]|uniref:Uncharacterized protein n=1 Tax=Gordonia humi TaxID=686429 RepID=A0A840F5C5_9ACTN|nr:hypothetical protein [Gordonia humi]MBB4134737.1 hypothetical protein [Gordonia humi]